MKYYIYRDNTEEGPFDDLEVEAKLRESAVSSENLARRENESQWQPLSVFFPHYAGNPHSWMQNSENFPPKESKNSYQERPQQSINEQQQNAAGSFAPPQPFEPPKPPTQNFGYQQVRTEETMPLVALIGGILCASFMLLGLVPCLGWINWIMLLAGVVNIVLSIVAITGVKNQSDKNKAVIGLILTVIAMCIGTVRLVAGFGCV